jgi:P-type Mg2+ transporter
MLSSAFDGLTFAVLLFAFQGTPALFRTAWFVESLLTELVIALVVRTRRPFFQSRPGDLLLWSTLVLVPLALGFPFLPYADLLDSVPLPAPLVLTICAITMAYVVAAEAMKARFHRSVGSHL